MVTVYDLKPRFQALLRPLAKRLLRAGVTANQVTRAAVVLSLGYGALLVVSGAPLVLLGLPALLLVRMGLNAIDGMMAREGGQESRFGFFLNEVGDVVSDTALYLPLALIMAPTQPILAAATVVAFALSEFAGVLGQAAGSSRRYDGPLGKSDRAVFFSVVAVAMAVTTLPGPISVALLVIALLLAIATTVNRVRHAVDERHD